MKLDHFIKIVRFYHAQQLDFNSTILFLNKDNRLKHNDNSILPIYKSYRESVLFAANGLYFWVGFYLYPPKRNHP